MIYFRFVFVFLGILQTEAVFYTAWTVWLWLDNSLNLDPDTVWGESGSSLNDATVKNVTDLVIAGTTGYRSVKIDDWSTNVPDLIRLAYRNADGLPLFSVIFNSTGSTSSDWFATSRLFVGPYQGMKCTQSVDFTSFSASFMFYNDEELSARYFASFIRKADTSTLFVITSDGNPLYLPASAVTSEDCHYSYSGSNPLLDTIEMPSMTRASCSSYCRERNIPYATVHNVSCSCLAVQPSGAGITDCTHPCEGDPSETCGGFNAAFPTEAIIFNYLNTDIYSDDFGTPMVLGENFQVTGPTEKSFSKAYYVYGLRLQIDASDTPVTVTIAMKFRAEACSDMFLTTNETATEVIYVADDSPTADVFEPKYLQCVYFNLYDDNNDPITFTVDMTLLVLEGRKFLTAPLFSIEASWAIEEPSPSTTVSTTTTTTPTPTTTTTSTASTTKAPTSTSTNTNTNSTEECECECWIYNLLYGTSPFQNLTYEEKEEALQEVTDQIQRELSVNKSQLSSTIRAKTSAEDSRPSAIVVGYTLGVALLTFSLGMIFLSDIPKILVSIHILYGNVHTLFGRTNPVQPDVTRTGNS